MGAKARVSTEMTVIATMMSVTACIIDSRAPKTRLNRYRVGRQMASVARKSSGSLTIDESACQKPLEAPSTRPKMARLTADSSASAR